MSDPKDDAVARASDAAARAADAETEAALRAFVRETNAGLPGSGATGAGTAAAGTNSAATPRPEAAVGGSRRPLSSRNSAWAARLASDLTQRGIAPNAISAAGVALAALGFMLFWLASATGAILGGIALILAALCCVARLVCNLLDGMVAIEGGQGTPDGPFWNEAPDRLSDVLLFTGAGIAAGQPVLGALIGAGSVTTAYLRELGRAEGLAADFSGPMAKQHRMAALAGVALVAALWSRELVLGWGLWLIALALLATIVRRSWTMITALHDRA